MGSIEADIERSISLSHYCNNYNGFIKVYQESQKKQKKRKTKIEGLKLRSISLNMITK